METKTYTKEVTKDSDNPEKNRVKVTRTGDWSPKVIVENNMPTTVMATMIVLALIAFVLGMLSTGGVH